MVAVRLLSSKPFHYKSHMWNIYTIEMTYMLFTFIYHSVEIFLFYRKIKFMFASNNHLLKLIGNDPRDYTLTPNFY
jgi:hypothetical protein